MAMKQPKPPEETFRAKVTGRHAVTLPTELRRQLGIETGDIVEFQIQGDQALVRRVPERSFLALKGVLRDYFRDNDDIVRFVREERDGWEGPDLREEQPARQNPPVNRSSTPS
jgi:AbrB family looped-hinge helix DNA binding protein